MIVNDKDHVGYDGFNVTDAPLHLEHLVGRSIREAHKWAEAQGCTVSFPEHGYRTGQVRGN